MGVIGIRVFLGPLMWLAVKDFLVIKCHHYVSLITLVFYWRTTLNFTNGLQVQALNDSWDGALSCSEPLLSQKWSPYFEQVISPGNLPQHCIAVRLQGMHQTLTKQSDLDRFAGFFNRCFWQFSLCYYYAWFGSHWRRNFLFF